MLALLDWPNHGGFVQPWGLPGARPKPKLLGGLAGASGFSRARESLAVDGKAGATAEKSGRRGSKVVTGKD